MYKQLWRIVLVCFLVCLLATGCRSVKLKKISRREQTKETIFEKKQIEIEQRLQQEIKKNKTTETTENQTTGEIIFSPIASNFPTIFTNPTTGKKDTVINAQVTFKKESKTKKENTKTDQTINISKTEQKKENEKVQKINDNDLKEITKNKETKSPGYWAWIFGLGVVLLAVIWFYKFLKKRLVP